MMPPCTKRSVYFSPTQVSNVSCYPGLRWNKRTCECEPPEKPCKKESTNVSTQVISIEHLIYILVGELLIILVIVYCVAVTCCKRRTSHGKLPLTRQQTPYDNRLGAVRQASVYIRRRCSSRVDDVPDIADAVDDAEGADVSKIPCLGVESECKTLE